MTITLLLFGMAAYLQQPSALDQAENVGTAIAKGEITKEQAEARLSECGIRRLDSSADGMIEGRMRRTTIRLCAADTESDADWLAKLEGSAAQVRAQTRLPDEVKQKLLADIEAEIARISTNRPAAAATVAIEPVASEPVAAKPRALADEIEPAPVNAAPVGRTAAMPGLKIRCHAPGDRSTGTDCRYRIADAVMLVTPDAAVPAGTRVRFRRTDGSRAADVILSSRELPRGQSTRVPVPKSICAGLIRADFTVEMAAGPSVTPPSEARIYGPFKKRC